MAATWVFGYGSLVSPASLAVTLARDVDVTGDSWSVAALDGWGRRWNYGGDSVGQHTDDRGVERVYRIVALGLVSSARESTNGIVVQVSDDELGRLDRRERHYDRIDVTERVTAEGRLHGRVVTYVPRSAAIERYQAARDTGSAAIDQRYWDLVHDAFAALGTHVLDRYRVSTPAPDVPVLPLRR